MRSARILAAAAALVAFASGAHAQQQTDPFPLPPRNWPKPVMDEMPFSLLLVDRLEYRARKGADEQLWDAQAWFGGDWNRLWLKSEGTRTAGKVEDADVQALYARRISAYWYVQAGVRQESRPEPSRQQGVLAIQGLAPYWFNVEASAFIRNGRASARLEAEYDQLLTQRLILQPRLETNYAAESEPARGIGKGMRDVEVGLRLRYEIRREFAPYVGISWSRKLGETADFARAQGQDVQSTSLVLGLRVWY